ncbi:MAG TPA: DUF2092 domain-containing protein, partial [Chthonomonadaceae bacterium]|nr:DUF2092 domain-containing protein [Chthonomonadaceae bacterium]
MPRMNPAFHSGLVAVRKAAAARFGRETARRGCLCASVSAIAILCAAAGPAGASAARAGGPTADLLAPASHARLAGAPAKPAVELKRDVAAIIKQSTETYAKMKSYKHTAKWTDTEMEVSSGREVHESLDFTLALDRPNRFAYKLDTASTIFPAVAAYCDGKTFINFKEKKEPTPYKQFIKTAAPAAYKGINIVDDVEFQPLGTYIVALMLQGDALADKDVRAALEAAVVKAPVTENGKKWYVLEMPFGQDKSPVLLYIGADDHLIGKSVLKSASTRNGTSIKITEVIEGIKIDKPIEPATFQYALPSDASEVKH